MSEENGCRRTVRQRLRAGDALTAAYEDGDLDAGQYEAAPAALAKGGH